MVPVLLAELDASALTLPVTVACSLLSAALGVGGSWAVMKRRIDDISTKQDLQDKRISELSDHREKHALDIQAIKQDLGYTRAGVERIQAMLERLMARAP